MADYHGVLRRTLAGFGEPTEQLRTKVYERARATIQRQLDTTNPPLSDAVKAAQIEQLAQAIEDVEAEYVAPAVPAGEADVLPEPDLVLETVPVAEPVAEIEPEPPVEPVPVSPSVAVPEVNETVPAVEDVHAGERAPEVVSEAGQAEDVPSIEPSTDAPDATGSGEPVVRSFVDDIQSKAGVTEPVSIMDEATANEAADVVAAAEAAAAAETPGAPAVELDSEVEPAAPEPPNAGDDAGKSGGEVFDYAAFERLAEEARNVGADSEAGVFADASDVPPADAVGTGDTGDASADASSEAVAPLVVDAGTGVVVDDGAQYFADNSKDIAAADALMAAPAALPVRKKRRGAGVVWTLLLLALVIGAAVVAWPQRGAILSTAGLEPTAIDSALAPYLSFIEDPNDPTTPKPVRTIQIRPEPEPEPDTPLPDVTEPTAPQPEAIEPEAPKRDERLGADGTETPPSAAREEVNTLPAPTTLSPVEEPTPEVPEVDVAAPTVPAVDTAVPAVAPIEPDAAVPDTTSPDLPAPTDTTTIEVPITPADETPDAGEADAAAADAEEAAVAEPASTSDAPAPAAAPAIPVSQLSLLIEEGAQSADGNSERGSVVWSLARETNSQGVEEPVIRGRAEIPEREVVAIVSIKRNADPALAASHLIEVVFALPDDFPGRGVRELTSIVAKSNPAEPGRPIVGVPVSIAPGIFFVALNNAPSAVESNVAALTGSDLIDIPMVYTSGRQAVLRLVKGAAGSAVFKQAFDAWAAAG